jgi:hypothetical protein
MRPEALLYKMCWRFSLESFPSQHIAVLILFEVHSRKIVVVLTTFLEFDSIQLMVWVVFVVHPNGFSGWHPAGTYSTHRGVSWNLIHGERHKWWIWGRRLSEKYW